MNFEEAVEYILSIPKFTKKNDLVYTTLFLKALGNPQTKQKIIHVAGTNGKGSVCAYLSSILVTAQKKVGLFTSPHLIRINERFSINGEHISDDVFLEIFQEVQEIIKRMEKAGLAHPTFFEFLFGMALLWFSRQELDYIILETGLGGRLDATNAIANPILSVITSISLDHTEILGNTIEEIAAEKAGILKRGVPVIFDSTNKVVTSIILDNARMLHAEFDGICKDNLNIFERANKYIDFFYKSEYYVTSVSLQTIARYQAVNCALAIKAIEKIGLASEIPVEIIQKGISQTKWAGRMELVEGQIYLDGAHNEDGIEAFIQTVNKFEKDNELYLLFAVVQEKNYEQMIERICTQVKWHKIILTSIDTARSVLAEDLAHVFSKYTNASITVESNTKKAYEELRREGLISRNSVLFCAGSLYLIGKIKEFIET